MSHNFPCSASLGALREGINPTCCIGKTILGGIYVTNKLGGAREQDYRNTLFYVQID